MLERGVLEMKSMQLRKQTGVAEQLSLSLELFVYVTQEGEEDFLTYRVPAIAVLSRRAAKSRFDAMARDPFSWVPTAGEQAISLEGIIFDPLNPLVLISGDVKKVGDTVADAVILEIKRDRVLFKTPTGKIWIPLERE